MNPKYWYVLIGILLLTGCASYAILIKTQCGLDAYFQVTKCLTYPRISKEKR